jgi:hypothetical protein
MATALAEFGVTEYIRPQTLACLSPAARFILDV